VFLLILWGRPSRPKAGSNREGKKIFAMKVKRLQNLHRIFPLKKAINPKNQSKMEAFCENKTH